MGYAAYEDSGAGPQGWQPDMDTGAYPIIGGYEDLGLFAGENSGSRFARERQAPLGARGWRAASRRWIAAVIRRAGR